jgi:hypothetical protein
MWKEATSNPFLTWFEMGSVMAVCVAAANMSAYKPHAPKLLERIFVIGFWNTPVGHGVWALSNEPQANLVVVSCWWGPPNGPA